MTTEKKGHSNEHKTKHAHTETGKESTVFNCDKCSDTFEDLESMKDHQIIHSDAVKKLKNEIVHEVEVQDKKRISWGSSVITVSLVVLTIISVSQTVQSANILDRVKNGELKTAGSGPAALPASLDSLPKMVGGC